MTWILLAAVIVTAAISIYRSSRTKVEPLSQVSSDVGAPPRQPSHFSVPLFADDVPLKKGLPLSLSVETLGGISTMLIPRGTGLPTAHRETFSTATDDQTSIQVHVLVGDRTLAVDNVTVGKFSIVEIPRAPRGVPRFEVELAIDDLGTFRFSARDLASGKRQPVSSERSLSSPLSHPSVGRMLDDARAEEAKGEYGTPRTTPYEYDMDSVVVYTKELRDLVESTRAVLKAETAIPETARRRCEEQLKIAERLLEANALPERASVKLNALKADELEGALRSLREAAERCR
ncbi:Hsp70 family protein [Sorangium sp. So ce1389]|uniref:Hsp70 family protein n=1 Tax=Sorangium sp. So ce1389 TaxID=3133336 RepID=UPI003F627EA4